MDNQALNNQALEEWAALAALGLQDPEWGTLSAEVRQGDTKAYQAEFLAFQEAAAALAYDAPPVPLSPHLKDRLFERIAAAPPPAISLSVADLKQKATQVSWQPYPPTPGILLANLHFDLETREVQCFIRATGSVQFPQHRHAGNEEIVVLEGDLLIDGQSYQSGDRIHSTPNTIHRPETQNGCLIFIRTSIDDEMFL